MLRGRGPVRALGPEDLERVLAICGTDRCTNVFVAARALEAGGFGPRTLLGYRSGTDIEALCWTSANVIPVNAGAAALEGFARRIVRWQAQTSSLMGPRDQVLELWEHLRSHWGKPHSLRADQPLLRLDRLPSLDEVEIAAQVRPAELDEVDAVLPAAVHMFTHEIGYPPYQGQTRLYRNVVRNLIERRRTYIATMAGQVVFKADVGSVALGVSQLQGVWLDPAVRGRGWAAGLIAAAVEQSMQDHAPVCTLYVNAYNESARAAYARIGFTQVGTFATVLL